MFEILPLAEDREKSSKIKKCGALNLCDSSLRCHIQTCLRRDARDIGSFYNPIGRIHVNGISKIDPDKFLTLLVMAIVKLDLPFIYGL